MSTTTRSRRLFHAAAATFTAMALVAGCGGSAVTDSNALSADTAAQTDTGTTDTGTVETGTTGTGTTGTTTADTGTTPGGTAGGTGTTATTAPGTTGGTGGTGATGGTAGTGSKGGKGATGTAGTTATSAVEAMVTNSAIFGGKAPCKPATLSEIPIGNVSTLSGVIGELFAPVTPALNTFVASQNACGGLNGHKIKFYQADDQGDPATAATKAQEMITQKKVLAFTGNIQVLTIDGAAPVYKKYGIPIIGNDISQNTWWTNPLFFPQGSNHLSISYGYLYGLTKYHGVKDVGNIWCIEVPRNCEQINRAMIEMAPQVGANFIKQIQVSITAPSYVQQCLEFRNAGVKGLSLSIDAASMVRLARSCTQVGYAPKLTAYPLAVGNEGQFQAGNNKWLAGTYVPMNVFPWMGNTSPAEKYWQASIKKYNPGFTSGGAASLGWAAGALLVAASSELSATNPTTQQFLDVLWKFQGQKFTELGGLSGPKWFAKDKYPRVPYCIFAAVANENNNGWKDVTTKPVCTDIIAPSDSMNQKDRVA
jgi:branched-chain amino acid transport system substrate-binding protein